MKILVTGAAGFIGSHLTEELLKRGEEVRAFIRYNSRNDKGLLRLLPDRLERRIEYFAGDIKDPDGVMRAVKGCDRVFHLAALISIQYSYINPLDYVQTNIIGAANILNACRAQEVKRLIHTSTSETYGTAQYVPIDENHPCRGQSPYSASKIGADKLVESYYRSFGLPAVIVRPFNTFGPRQSPRAIIPTIIQQALAGGKTIRLGSLHPTRDFLYVEDTVRGFIELAAQPEAIGKAVNIGAGRDISIGDLARLIAALEGKKVRIVQEEKRIRPEKSEVERLLSDCSLAGKLIGWKPKVTLEAGLKKTIEWYRRNPDFYRDEGYRV